MSDHVIVETHGRVTKVTIARPEKKNAITQAMYAAMADALNAYSEDDSTRALLLTGTGDFFTSGNDLQDFATGPKGDEEPGVSRFLRAIKDCPKPVIAAVNGGAIGVGLTMLLHCDLVYASDAAHLSAPFVGLGLVPEAASSKLLPEAVGKAVAADIFYTGRKLSAEEALSFGLVARVFPAAELGEETFKIAAQVAASAPTALKRTKKLVRYEQDAVTEHMALEGKQFTEQLQSPEFGESVAAMMQKRAPVFE
ncbi:MAG: enoyl-CoA hydratase [Erythrobacter sp.]|nr:enoyl-CoA hydratase [Erythrobacter sp.]